MQRDQIGSAVKVPGRIQSVTLEAKPSPLDLVQERIGMIVVGMQNSF